jgi:BolA protein
MKISKSIEQKINLNLTPSFLNIINESNKHAGHSGNNIVGSETHFKIIIVADKFIQTSRVARHRLVYDLLVEELKEIHALSLNAYTEEEYSSLFLTNN